LYTRARSEKKVAADLLEAGIEVYFPVQKTLKQWSDRKKKVEEPLIRSYVFVKITGKKYTEVLKTYGVVKFVKFEGIPAPIPEWQINNLKILTGSDGHFEKGTVNYHQGDFVKITKGAMKGLMGRITKIRGRDKLVINLDVVKVNFTVDIHPVFVESIPLPADH